MSQNKSFQHEITRTSGDKFVSLDNLLILEKVFEQSGQDWIENLNIIEQLLVRVVDRLSQENPSLRSTFIVRRLPTYLAPFTNKNEYGIVIENVHFTITPPLRASSRASSSVKTDRPGTSNFGQIEIFYKPPPEHFKENQRFNNNCTDDDLSKEVLNENQAFCSHEVFKKFTAAFIDSYQAECELLSSSTTNDATNTCGNDQSGPTSTSSTTTQNNNEPFHYSGHVQLVGPHLLWELKETPEVLKIFTLNQPPLPLPKNLKTKCSVNVNYLKSVLTIHYGGTEVIVRPCLFYNKGFPRVNANILERLPLHHASYLQIGESLRKGFLLFPTSFETLWTLNFWASESHILSLYHPSSIISRVFKLYSVFCINPLHFWEIINTSFLVGMDDSEIPSLMENSKGNNLLNFDYLMSSLLFELEDFCHIEDWAPRNFKTRFMHLLKTAVDCFEKGFHSHYYTKINVLRGIWKKFDDSIIERDERSVLRELDDITESQENLDDYGEKAIMEMDDLEDDFGFHFDDLETIDNSHDDIRQSRPNSETIYKNLNPRYSRRDSSSNFYETATTVARERPTTLSRMFGSNLVKKFGSKLSRRHSEAASVKKSITDADIASSFEESVAHMRRPDSLRLRFKFQTESDLTETSFSELKQQIAQQQRRGTIPTGPSTSVCAFQNEGFQNVETIYSTLLLNLTSNQFDQTTHSSIAAATDLDKIKKALESQEELITIWGKACNDFPKPKYICPHIFNPRQIQYLSLIIRTVSKCSPNMIQIIKTSKIPAWEISGDILRTVLHQMRMEVAESESLKEKQRLKKVLITGKQYSESFSQPRKKKSTLSMKFSLRKRQSNNFACQHDFVRDSSQQQSESDAQFALEEPEIAATHRLLEWLWTLRCSEIGRLSTKAYQYIEQLYQSSLINSHFIEQFSDDKMFSTMALKSAMAVTNIMTNLNFPVSLSLCAATAKGWLWAEMILSLASWNNEKGYIMKTTIPKLLENDFLEKETEMLERVLTTENATGNLTTLKKKHSICNEGGGGGESSDLDAATLAYHSELATPIGWNDFEDPRRPGPLAVAILIFSSTSYYKKWEMSPGNIVQVLVRLQKFNSLQHVGALLNAPHRKTALNEIRKFNKSLSVRIYNFDDNVMSKTFRRLRATRSRMMRREQATGQQQNEDITLVEMWDAKISPLEKK